MRGVPPSGSEVAIRVVHGVWIAGYLVGTSTHLLDLLSAGTNVYAGFPDALRVFWVSLVVIDPLVALLLALRRRWGVRLGVAVILVDIGVNWTAFTVLGGLSWFGVISQTLFAVFVVSTARALWAWFTARD